MNTSCFGLLAYRTLPSTTKLDPQMAIERRSHQCPCQGSPKRMGSFFSTHPQTDVGFRAAVIFSASAASSCSIPSAASVRAGKMELHLHQFLLRQGVGRSCDFGELLRTAPALEGELVCLHENRSLDGPSRAYRGSGDPLWARHQLDGAAIRL